MAGTQEATPPWWAKGTLFENCDCTSVCPAHISFRQPCIHERCIGYWAISIHEGRFGETDLAGLRVFIVGDSPQLMIEGGWTQEVYVDERANNAQRQALDAVLAGRAGSGWAVLAQFVGERLETRYVPIEIEEGEGRYAVRIDGILESTVQGIKGADSDRPVTLRNLPNQIHGSEHILALGNTRFEGAKIRMEYQDTNALISSFSWQGP